MYAAYQTNGNKWLTCDASSPYNVSVASDGATTRQQWYILPNDDGTYRIVSRNFSVTRCLAPAGNGTADGTNIVLQSWTGADSQKWDIVHIDPFHEENIEYIRVKKYDQSAWNGDKDITTIVTKSRLEDEIYFEAFAPNRDTVAFVIDSSLINSLHTLDESYVPGPSPNVELHRAADYAKKIIDKLVEHNIVDAGSAEYYGMWTMETIQFCGEINHFLNQVRLTFATLSAAYSIYNFVSSFKSMQMAINTTATYFSSDYKVASDVMDDILERMTKNPSSDTIMLGTSAGGVSWNEIAEQEGFSYFYSPNYEYYVSRYSADAMLAANKKFIYSAKSAGKIITFSHDPLAQLSSTDSIIVNSSYTRELLYIQKLYNVTFTDSNIIEYGDYWLFLP